MATQRTIAALIANSLKEQSEGNGSYVYVDQEEDLSDVVIDGRFDLLKLADAILFEVNKLPQSIEITPDMVYRFERGVGYGAPCVVCGGKFPECHDVSVTEVVIKRIKALGSPRRKQIVREFLHG